MRGGPQPNIQRGCGDTEYPWVRDDGSVNGDLKKIYLNNAHIVERGHVRYQLYDEYNFRLNQDFRVEIDMRSHLDQIYKDQDHAFKINLAFTVVLKHKHDGQYRFYYAHDNNSCLDSPYYIHNADDIEPFLQEITEDKILATVMGEREDSSWDFHLLVSVRYVVCRVNFCWVLG